jgi:hypothetical protein
MRAFFPQAFPLNDLLFGKFEAGGLEVVMLPLTRTLPREHVQPPHMSARQAMLQQQSSADEVDRGSPFLIPYPCSWARPADEDRSVSYLTFRYLN